MPCVSVCVRGEWLRLPCGGPSASVGALGAEALRRYRLTKQLQDGGEEFTMRRCCGDLLHLEDRAEEVLQDNDFVELGKDTTLYQTHQCYLEMLSFS